MIEIADLHVHYGRVQALASVSISVSLGQIFAVLGANGAGKTTLLRSILGLTNAKGAIRFDGADISRLSVTERVRRGIALVPEGRRLFPDFTVEENLKIGAFNRTDRAEVQRDIDEVCESFPILKERYQQRSRTLSGGEGQMLSIARALMSRPRFLMLDEPSLGIMPRIVDSILDVLQMLHRQEGLTVLLVEQNVPAALAAAERGYVLQTGRIVAEGTSQALLDSDLVRRAYLGM